MSKILKFKEASKLREDLQTQNKSIVLVGGCFDVLHLGHLTFLREAKKRGDILVILLESDESIKKTKGKNRPINSQHDRAFMLEALEMVDAIILLEPEMTDKAYDSLVITLKPAIIATTAGDTNRRHKERQAEKIGAEVVTVTKPVANKSTSRLISLLEEI